MLIYKTMKFTETEMARTRLGYWEALHGDSFIAAHKLLLNVLSLIGVGPTDNASSLSDAMPVSDFLCKAVCR